MSALIREKLAQAAGLVAASGVDAWLTFDRETADGGDPVLPLILEGGLTWQSALLVTRTGRRIALVGSYDADPLRACGDWDEVLPYVEGIREPLLRVLDEATRGRLERPRLAVNFSTDDVKADGLSHGMFLLLEGMLRGTRFEGTLESAQEIVTALRSRKTPAEIARMRGAIRETERIFAEVPALAARGGSERELFEAIQARVDSRGLGYGWDRAGNPIVNSGPHSMLGHGVPSAEIRIEPGHVLHLDLGVISAGYSSDIQRCWYVAAPGETDIPPEVTRALEAVTGAITAGSDALRPGVPGWRVDAAARDFLLAQGYPDFQHAFGHQVGRAAHDGGAILGPHWERYGRTPHLPAEPGHVYTLELGVVVPGRGYLGVEEMVRVTDTGIEWLTERQLELPVIVSEWQR
ncbi:MAG: M24 family metallopeptidase [Armatimonadota bacterium]